MISRCMRDRILLVKARAQWKRGDIEALVMMNSPCMRDRILLVKAQAQWKRGAISKPLLERRSRRYQRLQFRYLEWNKGAIGDSGLPVAS
jgi:hypothetical protein